MSDPIAAREALIIEAIGDATNLMDDLERLIPEFREVGREVSRANVSLINSLASIDSHFTALTERAKTQTVKHILARTDEAARRSIELQSRAMGEAVHAAMGAEIDATLQRLQAIAQAALPRPAPRWEAWLTHAAAAVVASALTWALAAWLWAG